MPLYEATTYYEAVSDDVANDLYDDMLEGLGCANDPDHECPHFRVGFGPLEVPETRRAALRRARREFRHALALVVKGTGE